MTAPAICRPVAPVFWGRPKSVAGKWMAPLELLVGCVAAGDEVPELLAGCVAAGDEVPELLAGCVPAGDEVLALAQPAATKATAETTAIARPVRARRDRGRAGPPPGSCFSDGISAVPAA
jgi:hypothetical protein